MKKLLFSILMVLGLFVVGCGKDGETGGIFSAEDKSRPKLIWQDTNFDGKSVKEIIVVLADKEAEDKLFEKALKSQEEVAKTFPFLTEEEVEQVYKDLIEEKNGSKFVGDIPYYDYAKSLYNLENSYKEFIRNDKFLREYISEEEIQKLYNSLEHKKLGQADFKIQKFNDYFIKSKILNK